MSKETAALESSKSVEAYRYCHPCPDDAFILPFPTRMCSRYHFLCQSGADKAKGAGGVPGASGLNGKIVGAHYLPSTSRNWHLPPKMRMPSTGDGRAGALFAGWWGATSEGVTSTFWKNLFLRVPVRFPGIRCKKRGHKKRKTAGVMPLFSRSSFYSLSDSTRVSPPVFTEEPVPLWHDQ
eukprot:jgi/Undpi1/3251/HiC_scaffold_15.g06625.m1